MFTPNRMLVRADTPVCNAETTTTDRITSTTISDAFSKATTVLTTVNSYLPMVIESEGGTHSERVEIDEPVAASTLVLETVLEEQEIVRWDFNKRFYYIATKFTKFQRFSSICDTASVASDLTRMYVSDEDERHSIDMQIAPSSL